MNKSLLTKVMAGTVALSTSSCRREPIHRISDASKYPIIERVDSFVKSNLNEVDTTFAEKIKTDTLEISNSLLNDKKELVEYLDKNARRSNSNVIMSSGPEYCYGLQYNGKIGWGWKIKDEVEPKYISSEMAGVMQNKVYTNKSEDKFFVPVNYYGVRNPNSIK